MRRAVANERDSRLFDSSHRTVLVLFVTGLALMGVYRVINAVINGAQMTFVMDGEIVGLAFDADGERLLAMSGQGGLSLAHLPDRSRVRIGNVPAAKAVAVSFVKGAFYSLFFDRNDKLCWCSIDQAGQLGKLLTTSANNVELLRVPVDYASLGWNQIATADRTGHIVTYDYDSGQETGAYSGANRQVVSISMWAGSNDLIWRHFNGSVWMGHKSGNEPTRLCDSTLPASMWHRVYKPSSSSHVFINTGSEMRGIKSDGSHESLVLSSKSGPIREWSWSADGRRVALLTLENCLELWRIDRGEMIASFRVKRATALAMSSCGKWVACGCEDGKVQIWRTPQHFER